MLQCPFERLARRKNLLPENIPQLLGLTSPQTLMLAHMRICRAGIINKHKQSGARVALLAVCQQISQLIADAETTILIDFGINASKPEMSFELRMVPAASEDDCASSEIGMVFLAPERGEIGSLAVHGGFDLVLAVGERPGSSEIIIESVFSRDRVTDTCDDVGNVMIRVELAVEIETGLLDGPRVGDGMIHAVRVKNAV